VISGFNTDIEADGVTYHVQTEDKGLETPFLLSLVYVGGEILAAKRSPYDDLIAKGFDETALTERLQRQHRLICAAIKQGRIEDLKRMSMPATASKSIEVKTEPEPEAKPETVATTDAPPFLFDIEPLEIDQILDIPIALVEPETNGFEILPDPPIDVSEHSIRVLRTDAPLADFARAADVPIDALNLTLLEDREFRGGDRVTLRVLVTKGGGASEREIAEAEIMVKVLGAAFRPVIFHARTAANGIAAINLQFPHFKTGRAALLIKAVYGEYEAELRRIVTQG
jgi:hypothetical protein